MKLLIFSFLFSAALLAEPYPLRKVKPAYKDEELNALWSSISHINNPTLEDYLAIENYLKYGRRPYLDALFNTPYLLDFQKKYNILEVDRSSSFSNRVLQNLMLVGSNKEMPVFKKICLGGASPSDLTRCIVFYTSYNESFHTFDKNVSYSKKVLEIIKELEKEGYKGHVLFRMGGYPLTEKGGLKLAHVPYSFKVLSLIEASHLGYENVLWLDSTIHPTNNLEDVFLKLSQEGIFLLGVSATLNIEYELGLLSDASLASSSLDKKDLQHMEQITAAIVGVSFKNKKSHKLIQEWYRLTTRVYPAMTLFPEQFLLSIAAYRAKLNTSFFRNYMYLRSEEPIKPSQDKEKPFWFDKG